MQANTATSALAFWCHPCAIRFELPSSDPLLCPFCHDGFVEQLDDSQNDHGSENDADRPPLSAMHTGNDHSMDPPDTPNHSDTSQQPPRVFTSLASIFDLPINPLPSDNNQNPGIMFRNILEQMVSGTTLPAHHNTTYYTTVMGGPQRNAEAPGSDSTPLGPSNEPPDLIQIFGRVLGGLGLQPIVGNAGDYVFGESHFDQIISQMMDQTGRDAPPPAPEEIINNLPQVLVTQEHIDKNADCSICQDKYEKNESVIQLPCDHLFHKDCVFPWLRTNGTCPTCRGSLITINTQSSNQQTTHSSSDNQDSNNNNRNVNENHSGVSHIPGGWA